MASSILALDIGEKRIGVAIADSALRFSSPLMTLDNDDNIKAVLRQLITEHDVTMVIAGLPRNMSGEDTAQTRYVRNFIDSLELPVETVFQDEALTSRKAEEELRLRGKPYVKGDIDKLAATYILEDYLRDS